MRSYGWVLLQYDRCPYKKRGLGFRHTQRKTMGGHGEKTAVYTPGETSPHLGLGLPASRTVRRLVYVVEPPICGTSL